jgi:hypothetical protein
MTARWATSAYSYRFRPIAGLPAVCAPVCDTFRHFYIFTIAPLQTLLGNAPCLRVRVCASGFQSGAREPPRVRENTFWGGGYK